MKYLGIITLLLITSGCSTSYQVSEQKSKEIKEKIVINLTEQKEAWNAGDIKEFMKHYWQNDSMAFMSNSGIRYGWKQTLDAYESSYPSKKEMGTLEFKVKKLDVVSHNAAYMLGSWALERDTLDVSGHFSLIWKEVDGNWVIVTDHTS